MLENAYLLAKIGADTAENERNFAENLRNCENLPKYRSGIVAAGPLTERELRSETQPENLPRPNLV